jgi:hypothetical protein
MNVISTLNVKYLFQWMSKYFNVMFQSLRHSSYSRTVSCMHNSNAANKPRILRFRFSKIGFFNLSVFTYVLDVCADIMDIRRNVFGLPAPSCGTVSLLRNQYAHSSKKFRNSQKTSAWEEVYNVYPINGIWPTDRLTLALNVACHAY